MKGKLYHCKDNDVAIRVQYKDGKPDELWLKAPGDSGWLVVGVEDIKNALKLKP